MTKDEINEFRAGFKSLMSAMVDMARANGEPIMEIMQVMRDAPASVDELCDQAIKGLSAPPEGAPTMWVPVTERVPGYEDDGEVLVVSIVSRRVGVRTARYLTALANEAKQNGEDCAYTHWAPMPEAPSSPQKATE